MMNKVTARFFAALILWANVDLNAGAPSNKSLDASGESVFRIMTDPAKGD